METTVLRTKLKIPLPRPEHVYRSRLTEMLESGLYGENGFARKMTLVSAPAGYGKTNLLAEWLYRGGGKIPPGCHWINGTATLLIFGEAWCRPCRKLTRI